MGIGSLAGCRRAGALAMYFLDADRAGAAGIDLIAVLIVLVVAAVILWFLFTGPLAALRTGAPSTGPSNVNATPPAAPSPKPGG